MLTAERRSEHSQSEADIYRVALQLMGPDGFDARLTRSRAFRLELARQIAMIDALLNQQINAILHHPRFQRLESSWRGVRYLVDQAALTTAGETAVEIHLLHATWAELSTDLERAVEFDQSRLFHLVYTMCFGMPGGKPIGLLVGDYEIGLDRSEGCWSDDPTTLRSIAEVAAAAFSPFVAAAGPDLFGLDSFRQLERSIDLEAIFSRPEYMRWRKCREGEDSRFVGLVLPRILMRLPYERHDRAGEVEFCFREDVGASDLRNYLWGNAAYAFAAVVIRAFHDSGWLADIRGVKRGADAGGIVTTLPVHCFSTDRRGVAIKGSTDLIVLDDLERQLSELGFIALCQCKDTPYCAFYSNQSVQRSRTYDDARATMNSRISTMLQYILCASRFAHYLKVIARDKVGSVASARELRDFLDRWLNDYRAPDAHASDATKARYPLYEAEVEVSEQPGRPGIYNCNMRLVPHYQLDALAASIRLTTEMVKTSTTSQH